MAIHNDVLRQQIWEFFQNDLHSCLEVSRQVQQARASSSPIAFQGGLNFTSALVIFSVLDLCSGFFSGAAPTTQTVSDFITEYLGKRDRLFSDSNFSLEFYRVFRHGLAHQWSPKRAGVSMDFNDPRVVFLLNENDPCLNVPPFFKLVCDSLHDFEDDLDNTSNLQQNFLKRYNSIVSQDQTAANRLVRLL